MKILIVEDNPKVRKLIRQALDEGNNSFVEASDGADALGAYEIARPDLVLMDIRMPKVDGLTATRELTRHFPEARVLMLTDYDEDALRAAALDAGAEGYLLKFDLGELASLVERAY